MCIPGGQGDKTRDVWKFKGENKSGLKQEGGKSLEINDWKQMPMKSRRSHKPQSHSKQHLEAEPAK